MGVRFLLALLPCVLAGSELELLELKTHQRAKAHAKNKAKEEKKKYLWYHMEKTGVAFGSIARYIVQSHGGSWRQLVKKEDNYEYDRLLVNLRNPYRHTRSLYHHTALNPNGLKPFTEWLWYFQNATLPNGLRNERIRWLPRFYSHPPINYQSYWMKVNVENPNVHPFPGNAMNVVKRSAWLVGITELMHETLCIMHGKLGSEDGTPLPSGCDCRDEEAWKHFQMPHDDVGNSHNVDHSHDAELMSLDNMKVMDTMTKFDWLLFKEAAIRMRREAQEIEDKFNTKIFCGNNEMRVQQWAEGQHTD